MTPGLVYPRLQPMEKDCAKIPVDTVRRHLSVRHASKEAAGYVVVNHPERLLADLDRAEVLYQLARASESSSGATS